MSKSNLKEIAKVSAFWVVFSGVIAMVGFWVQPSLFNIGADIQLFIVFAIGVFLDHRFVSHRYA